MRSFVNREGHVAVIAKHVEDGFKLGSWLNVRRKPYREGRLASYRIEQLEELP